MVKKGKKKMAKFTKELVDKYADDLLIGLTKEENKMVLDEFEIIDENMELITKIPNIESIEPMTHPLEYHDIVLRSDIVKDELTTDEVLANAKNVTEEEIIVPKVVE